MENIIYWPRLLLITKQEKTQMPYRNTRTLFNTSKNFDILLTMHLNIFILILTNLTH